MSLLPSLLLVPCPSPFFVLGREMLTGSSTADSCTPHGDAFVQYPGVTDLYSYTDVNGNMIDAGNSMTSFLCQECTACT